MTTDDPSEVRPGDVRSVEGVIGEVWGDGASFTMRGAAGPTMFSSAELAVSTLIRRAKPEIAAGMLVKLVRGPHCEGKVRAVDGDDVWVDWTYHPLNFVPSDIVRLSDITPVEDKADG